MLSRSKLIEYLQKVAHHLGDWKIDQRCEHRLCLINDAQCINVSQRDLRKSDQGKIFFAAILSRGYLGAYEDIPKMTASFSRSPASVAKDITRKILPALNGKIQEAKERQQKKQADKEALKVFAHLIENVGLDDVIGLTQKDDHIKELFARQKNLTLNFELVPGYGSSLKVGNLTQEQTIKLTYFLKNL